MRLLLAVLLLSGCAALTERPPGPDGAPGGLWGHPDPDRLTVTHASATASCPYSDTLAVALVPAAPRYGPPEAAAVLRFVQDGVGLWTYVRPAEAATLAPGHYAGRAACAAEVGPGAVGLVGEPLGREGATLRGVGVAVRVDVR